MGFQGNDWFKLALNLRSSVIQNIKIQVLLTMGIVPVITIFYQQGYSGFS